MNRLLVSFLVLCFIFCATTLQASPLQDFTLPALSSVILQFAADKPLPGRSQFYSVVIAEASQRLLNAYDQNSREYQTFLSLYNSLPTTGKTAIDPLLDNLCKALVARSDEQSIEEIQGHFSTLSSRTGEPIINDEALADWLKDRKFIHAVSIQVRDWSTFLQGLQTHASFLFEGEHCYEAGHQHNQCPAGYFFIADYHVAANEGNKPYWAERSAHLKGVFHNGTFTAHQVTQNYYLQAVSVNGHHPHPSYTNPEDWKFRRFSFNYNLNGELQSADRYIKYFALNNQVELQPLPMNSTTLEFAEREKRYWDSIFN